MVYEKDGDTTSSPEETYEIKSYEINYHPPGMHVLESAIIDGETNRRIQIGKRRLMGAINKRLREYQSTSNIEKEIHNYNNGKK
tara:strand:- start:88071 stop:88322 length:252 start_codon:yes stop_codon:yes gene_type:complete